MKSRFLSALAILGPGFAVAATGVGAGDIVAAAVAGSTFGYVVIWAAIVGAVLKFSLNEGVARWQLATGTTLIEGWSVRLGRWFLVGFFVYLLLWTLLVSAALMAACGLALHAMIPSISVSAGGILHSVVALVLVLIGRYALFERTMKLFIGLLFVTVVGSALLSSPDWAAVAAGLIPRVPSGGGALLLGVIGGVGGSVTILSYSYWMRERGWAGVERARTSRIDLMAAYTLTGLFGMAIVITAAGLSVEQTSGNDIALAIAGRMGEVIGPAGKWIFLVGFWGAVFSSMLGVWQGVPYIFADCRRLIWNASNQEVTTSSTSYRGFLIFMATAPALILLAGKPVWIVIAYSIFGAFFMPLLAGSLLWLNNRRSDAGELKNGRFANLLLISSLLLFLFLGISEIMNRLS